MNVASTARVHVKKNVFVRRFDADLVILDMEGGEYFGLDELGARVWERLAEGCTPQQIVDELSPGYTVTPQAMLHDILVLVESLLGRGLVALEPASE